MKHRCALVGVALLHFCSSANLGSGSPLFSDGSVTKVENAKVTSHSDNLGQVAGIEVDDSGNLFAFHRGPRTWQADSFDAKNNFNTKKYGVIAEPTITVFSPSGEIRWQGGANRFYMPHGLSVDAENVWVTDVALHQVFKIPKGSDEPSLVLGTAFKNGNDNLHFCKPTDVAVASDGTIFVSDGYCNSRIVRFSPAGKFLSEWGQPSDPPSIASPYPPAGQFNVPHSLTLVEDWDLLCVADRENERIQCFSAGLGVRALPAGTFIKKAEGLGRVYAVDQKDHHLAGVTGPGGRDRAGPKLFVVDLNTGDSQIVDKGLRLPHDVALSHADGEMSVFVADISETPAIQKIEL